MQSSQSDQSFQRAWWTRLRLQALLCALVLPLSALLIRPQAEMGMVDDWSYAKTVHILAQTGHIAYNGWSAPIVGWLMFWGAAFVRIFGYSYAVLRWSDVVIAMATAFLVQRTFVRAGIHEWNATLGTLTLVLSSIYLPTSFLFMTDIAGLLGLIVCLYACLRSLQARSDNAALAWVGFAALSNALLGSVRQTTWLGVLIMVPCTLWVLWKRRQQRAVVGGAICFVIGTAIVLLTLRWYAHQPYSVPEELLPSGIKPLTAIKNLMAGFIVRGGLQLALLLSPLLLMFALASGRRGLRLVAAVLLASSIAYAGIRLRVGHFAGLGPWIPHNFTPYGFTLMPSLEGKPPLVFGTVLRAFLTAVTFAGLVGLFVILRNRSPRPDHLNLDQATPSKPLGPGALDLATLVVPCSLVYILLLLPRVARSGALLDRYLLFVMAMALLGLLRAYQHRIAATLPALCLALIVALGSLDIVAAHDAFAEARGRLAAVNHLMALGIPATQIDGGAEFNSTTEVEQTGYLHDPNLRVPANLVKTKITVDAPCHPYTEYLFPSLHARYALSYEPGLCAGPSGFAPTTYQTWLPPYTVYIYTVRYAAENAH